MQSALMCILIIDSVAVQFSSDSHANSMRIQTFPGNNRPSHTRLVHGGNVNSLHLSCKCRVLVCPQWRGLVHSRLLPSRWMFSSVYPQHTPHLQPRSPKVCPMAQSLHNLLPRWKKAHVRLINYAI